MSYVAPALLGPVLAKHNTSPYRPDATYPNLMPSQAQEVSRRLLMEMGTAMTVTCRNLRQYKATTDISNQHLQKMGLWVNSNPTKRCAAIMSNLR